jgi:hypothetical protein
MRAEAPRLFYLATSEALVTLSLAQQIADRRAQHGPAGSKQASAPAERASLSVEYVLVSKVGKRGLALWIRSRNARSATCDQTSNVVILCCTPCTIKIQAEKVVAV